MRPRIDPAAAPPELARLLERARASTDREIERRLPLPEGAADDPARRLIEAMRYAALAPGKRLRPAIALAACEAAGGTERDARPAAAAVELLHCYTLVHDDLPAMDDDDERRGRPSLHRAFDEATAILAGDGLLTLAFAALADLGPRAADAVAALAARAGGWELLAGQALDLAAGADRAARPRGIDLTALERIHAGKTGALFSAAAELGGIAAGAAPPVRHALARYGLSLGIAFQHADDLDDGDFAEHAAAAAQRRAELAGVAATIGAELGSAALADLARWTGGLS